MKQSAVEWLAEQMLYPEIFNPYIEQAKEMEKQQIIDALHYFGIENAKQYYNEKFNIINVLEIEKLIK